MKNKIIEIVGVFGPESKIRLEIIFALIFKHSGKFVNISLISDKNAQCNTLK